MLFVYDSKYLIFNNIPYDLRVGGRLVLHTNKQP